MPDDRQSIASRLPGIVAFGVAVAVAAYFAIYAFVPSARHRLSIENGVIELTTAFVFLAAAVVGTFGMIRTRAPHINWLIPVFGLLGFLDGMMLGATFLPFSPPIVDGVEIDSFHDILIVVDRLLADLGVTRFHVAVLVGVVSAVALAVILERGHFRKLPAWVDFQRPVVIAAGGVVLILVGIVLDQLSDWSAVRFLEETAEFAASGLVLVAATALVAGFAVALPRFGRSSCSSTPVVGHSRSPRRPR